MGFLSGVLGAVKNTQTYNVGKKILQNLVSNEITKYLCSGHDGFTKLLPILTQGIERYNKEVRDSNEKVKRPIEDLLNQVGDAFTNKVNDLLSGPNDHENVDKVQAAEKQIKNMFRDEIKTFNNTFNNAYNFTTKIEKTDMKIAIHYLNSSLQLRVKHGVSNVAHEIKRLEQVADKESKALEETKEKISATLSTLTTGVDCKIDEQIQAFVRRVKEKVNVILEELNAINKQLTSHVNALYEWIEKADKTLEKTLKKVDDIIKMVDREDPTKYPKQIGMEIEQVAIQVNMLLSAGNETMDKIRGLVPEAHKQLKLLEDAVMYDLNGVQERLLTEIGNYVKGYVGKIQQEVKKITDPYTGLEGVRQHIVYEYTEAYKNFDGVVQQWIVEILEHNVSVKDTISEYVRIGNVRGKFNDECIDTGKRIIKPTAFKQIADVIKQKIKELGVVMENATVDMAHKNDIQANITAVHESIFTFTKLLDQKFETKKPTSRTRESFVAGVGAAIEHAVVDGDVKTLSQSHITPVVTAILDALYTKSNQALTELSSLTGEDNGDDNIGKHLDAAQGVAGEIFAHLGTAIESGSLSTYKSGKTKAGISDYYVDKDISEELEKELPQALDERGSGTNKVKLTKFTSSFTNARRDGADNTKKKALVDKINEIQTKMDEALQPIGNYSIYAGDHLREIGNKLNRLCEEIRQAAGEDNAEGVRKRLKELKERYFLKADDYSTKAKESIRKIHCDISTLQRSLADGPINKISGLVAFLTKAETDVAKALKEEVHGDIKNAEDKLTTSARKQYVCAIKELFTSFAERVKKDFQSLPNSLDLDLNAGLKGFMGRMATTFIPNVKPIDALPNSDSVLATQRESALSQGAAILNTAVNLFVRALREQKEFMPDLKLIKPVHDALDNLLSGLVTSQCYDHTFSDNLNAFRHAFEGFNPSKFGEPTTVLTQALKEGLNGLTKELGKAYVNRYSGLTYDESDAAKYGKAFLTLLCIVHEDLDTFSRQCKSNGAWYDKQCCANENRQGNPFGQFMERCGFDVASSETSKDGELKHPSVNFTGKHIYKKLLEKQFTDAERIKHLQSCESNEHKKRNNFDLLDITQCLFHHAEKYNELCHIPTASSTKVPSSIYDMLIWFCSLPYSAVYPTLLRDTISDLVTDKSKQKPQAHDGLEFTFIDPASQSLAAYPDNIPYSEVVSALAHLCSKSHDILTCIVGYGDAYTTYGSDYCNNSFGFKYPSSGEDCLQMITDLLRRLLHCLRYLHKQCGVTAKLNGWSDCIFGKNVKSAKWECKDHSTDEPNCQANDKVTCQPTCQAKSPLQSYLTDCLYGHLPHQLTSVGCKSTCKSCPGGSPGMPCLTPLGFRAFSGSTRKGTDLCEVLDAFFSNDYLSSLFTLAPRPPATLPEHIGFALSLAAALNDRKPVTKPAQESFSDAFEKSIKEATISLHDNPSNYTAAVKNAYKNTQSHDGHSHPPATEADVYTLMFPSTCLRSSDDTLYCAPYLYTLGTDTHYYLAYQHSNLYLSWTVYLPWTFYSYLRSLLEAFKNVSCQEWECSRCMHRGKCKKGQHGVDYNCQCRGIIECRGVSSAFHKYGFTFGDPAILSEVEGKRYCHNFYNQLVNVLKSNCFAKLFDKCDEFLWIIRQPFTYLVLALWSLSLLYLICVMVGRLDVLHIRSHLRSPSSHKITAQSLLAAAQVGRLAKISYLQP
ncbi:hypothetical protein, conserved [Babesia bigemina]|uniref:C3H1-type domain-containing protein n=1 Tax=Babesia bigemina TaxID=5866 RepID=A0A061BKG7_BABBI|nr:hypothetical protein, conserved [Babesia bigemina]CDR71932.1 hypothetical protein, conserved [Babesia bigemina]|eukprot:XP_012770874.1 hypothetical protein, conserved [Babesia bigemina]